MAIEYTPELGLPYPTSTNPVRVHTDVKDLAVKVDNTVGSRISEQVGAAKTEAKAYTDSKTGSIYGAATTYTDQKVNGVLGDANAYTRSYSLTGDNAVRSDLTPRISALEELGGLAPGDVSDATVASLVGNITTTSNQAIHTLVGAALTPGMVIATATRFPNLHPDEDVDSAQGILDAIAATPDNGTLIFPEGDYHLYTTMFITDPRGVRIFGYGARLVKHTTVPLLEVRGGFDTVYSVAAGQPAETIVTSDGEPQPATILSLTGTPNWLKGDVVKIVADDFIPERRPEDGVQERRVARFAVVESVSANQAVVVGKLNDAFTTNIRVARFQRHRIEIHGFHATAAPELMDPATQDNTPMFNFISLHSPTIKDVTVEQAKGTAFRMAYCFGYKVLGVQVEHGITSRVVGNFGYAVQDVGSAYGRVDGLISRRARSAFTDDSSQIAANSNLHMYGRSYGAIISNSVAIGGGGSGFTTHHNGERHQFVNLAAYDCLGVAVALRGRHHTARGVTSVNCLRAASTFCEDIGGQTYGIVFDGVYSLGSRHYAIRVQKNPTGHPQAAGVREERPDYFSNVVIAESDGGNIYVENANVIMRNVSVEVSPVLGNSNGLFVVNNSEVELDDTRLDYRRNTTGTSLRVFQTWDTTKPNQITIADLRVRNTSGHATRISRFFDFNTNTVLKARRVSVDYKAADMTVPANASIFQWSASATDDSSAYYGTSAVTDETAVSHVARTGDQVVTLLALPGANSNLAPLPVPVSRGQMLVIINGNNTNTLTLVNTSGNRVETKSGANLSLAPGQSASFVWNTIRSRWSQVS